MIHRLKKKIAFALVTIIALLCAPEHVAAVTQICEVRVGSSDSDAGESSLGAVSLTAATLELGGPYRRVGLRFPNITIPRNATITQAYIEFTTAGQDSANTTFKIETVAQDNPTVFTSGAFNITTRPVYNTAVNWVMNYPWAIIDETHQSADIAAFIKMLVDRPGWASGNAMAFVISSEEDVLRKVKSWDSDPAKAAKLHIEYAINMVEVRVAASTDDVYQYTTQTVFNGNEAVLSYGSFYYSGFRFLNVNVPQGAVINSAYLKFVSKNYYPATTGYMRLMGENRLNPPTFSLSATNADSVVKRYMNSSLRGPYVQWSNTSEVMQDQEYVSADIKSIIQPLVGQAGWDTSSKSLALWFYVSGGAVGSQMRKVWTFDGDPAKAALLHIEYGQTPPGVGTDPPVISLSNTELGRSVFEGSPASNQNFSLMNSGATTLNYTTTVTYNQGSGWLSLSPAGAGGSLGAGESQNFAVGFNTTGFAAGTYGATIRFADPNAANGAQEVRVSLTIMPQGPAQCGEVPLYTKNISSPAVMILLDLSSSMLWSIDVIPENYDFTNAITPNLKSVVQEIVNRDGWVSGNAITFILEKISGAGARYMRSFEGYSPSGALFHLEYNDGSGGHTIETRIKRGTDDAESYTGMPFNTADSKLRVSDTGNGYGAAFRFDNLTIPKNATVTNAWIQFVPFRSDSDPITVKISADPSDNSPTFIDYFTNNQITAPYRSRTAANVTWNVQPWTGVTIEQKLDVAKTVIGELVKDTGTSWGFGSWAADITDGYIDTIDYTKIHVGCAANTTEHQMRLQTAIAGLKTYSSTPFSPSLVAGRKYFAGLKKDDDPTKVGLEDGEIFKESSCQPKFLIEVTDGVGNVDSTKENVIQRTDLLADQGVSVVGIGFGVPEGEDEQLYAMADTANTRGKASTTDNLYAMHPEDASGKAQPYLALNKDGLMDAFRTIMNNVKGAVFYGSAPAATTSTDLGDMVLLASFNAGNWTGDVEAISKDANGNWSTSLWKASKHFPTTRNVYTWDSKQVTSYTADTLAGDNYLCKNLGDIVHSTPQVVGAPPFFYSFDNYASFKRNLSVTNPRPKMVYVGSNDGLLHAFSLADGSEQWAFLPRSLQAKLNQAASGPTYDPCSTSYCHSYLLDGSPQVADVYGLFGGASQQWRTMLVVGQRGGGTAYTALDVTSGKGFNAADDPARFLWELTDADLGETWSDAAIERVSYPSGGTGATAWGVFVGSGYDPNDNLQPNKEAYLFGVVADTGSGLWSNGNGTSNKVALTPGGRNGLLNWSHPPSPTYNTWFTAGETVRGVNTGASATVYRVPNNAGSNVGTLELVGETGTFMHGEPLVGASGHNTFVQGFFVPSQIYDNSGHLVPEGVAQKNNATSSPVTGNFNAQDFTEDCIYLGDLYGTMYRVDNIGKGQSPTVSRLFKFNPYPAGPDERPIRGKVSVATQEGGSGLWVYYGTGRYETAADKGNTQQQYFFGLKDSPTPRASPYSLADLTTLEARFTTATIGGKDVTVRAISGANASAAPWAMKLFAGQSGWGGPSVIGSERVFTKPLTVGGIVFFTTFIPDADICTGSGSTYLFALDYKTGLPPSKPVFDLNGDRKFTDADKVDIHGAKVVPIGVYVGRGQGSAPVLFKDTLFVTTSTPQYQQTGSVGSGNVTGLNAFLVNIPQKKIRVESWKHN
jgi:hypothetical protein